MGRKYSIFESLGSDTFLRIKGRTETYRNKIQLIIKPISKTSQEDIKLEDYLPSNEQDVNKMFSALKNVFITRKDAISAAENELGIIPGSMGAKSFIVSGMVNAESFCSFSHGTGRRMSRGKAKRHFSKTDLEAQTEGIECRKDKGVLDEIPGAYKDIEEVMSNQNDLVDVVHTLRQVVCVKG